MEKIVSKQKIINGKRITNDDLFKFIRKNSESFKNIGCIDLNKIESDIKITKLNKLTYQDIQKINYLPPNLSKIFKLNLSDFNRYLHYGPLNSVTIKDKKTETDLFVTLFSSVIYCVYQSFSSLQIESQKKFIVELIIRMKKESSVKYIDFLYSKYKWNKTDLYKDMDNGVFGPNIIKYLSDYLSVNIFILDLVEDKLFFGGGNEFISFRKNIFLIKYEDDVYEPLFTEQSKTFSINDSLINYIKEHPDIINIYFSLWSSDLSSVFSEYLEPLVKPKRITKKELELEQDKKKKEIIDEKYDESLNAYNETDTEIIEEIKEVFIKSHKKSNKIIINSKMKVDELQKIALELGIDISKKIDGKKKNKTKQELIDDINKH